MGSPLEHLPDDELMQLARGGMQRAFEVLVARHQQVVIRVAKKYLQNQPEADDAVQNAFVEVYRRLNHYSPQGKFVPFLYRVVINECRMLLRSRRYEKKALNQLAEQRSTLPVNKDIPELQLLASEKRRIVVQAMDQLRPKLKEALILRFAGELSYKEIAQTLKIRQGTVKSRIFCGLAKLNLHVNGAAR